MDIRDLDPIVRRALDEDLPDITSEAIFEPSDRGRAKFLVKASGILAGLEFAAATFAAIDPSSSFDPKRKDGDEVEAGNVVAEVEASVIGLLAGERTVLNLMQRASGIATATRRYVEARSEEHTSNSSHVSISYAVFCLKKKRIGRSRR